jgi:hypothetical protein
MWFLILLTIDKPRASPLGYYMKLPGLAPGLSFILKPYTLLVAVLFGSSQQALAHPSIQG